MHGQRMHYLDEGPRHGPPVLMLHGTPSWSIYYRALVLALRKQCRCIVPDHIGCGLSDKPDSAHYGYRLANRIADCEALMAHLNMQRPVTLVMHDWGGMIGMAWAVRHSDRIERLVIMNTAAFPLPAEKRLPASLALARNSRVGAWLVLRCNAFVKAAAHLGFKQAVEGGVRRAYAAPYDTPANRIATLRFVQDIPLRQGDPGFDIVLNTAEHLDLFRNLPCLIAWGERDFVFDRSFLRKWMQIYPAAKVLRFAECGHYILEDGGRALVNAIRKFITDDFGHGHTFD